MRTGKAGPLATTAWGITITQALLGTTSVVYVGWPRAVSDPGLPQIRTCGFPASGSSETVRLRGTVVDPRDRERIALKQLKPARPREAPV